jgi:SAM-dependent methyltransferase
MGFYQDQIVPLLINLAMRRRDLAVYRSRVVPAAEGRVLEIGIGSGLNLPFYSRNVERLIGLDPSPKLLSMLRRAPSTALPRLREAGEKEHAMQTDFYRVTAVPIAEAPLVRGRA